MLLTFQIILLWYIVTYFRTKSFKLRIFYLIFEIKLIHSNNHSRPTYRSSDWYTNSCRSANSFMRSFQSIDRRSIVSSRFANQLQFSLRCRHRCNQYSTNVWCSNRHSDSFRFGCGYDNLNRSVHRVSSRDDNNK